MREMFRVSLPLRVAPNFMSSFFSWWYKANTHTHTNTKKQKKVNRWKSNTPHASSSPNPFCSLFFPFFSFPFSLLLLFFFLNGETWNGGKSNSDTGNRTRISWVKARCSNRYTTSELGEPHITTLPTYLNVLQGKVRRAGIEPAISRV